MYTSNAARIPAPVRWIINLIVFVLLLGLILTAVGVGVARSAPGAIGCPWIWAVHNKLFFGIDPLLSGRDADCDGIDDYLDIMLTARAYIRTNPRYAPEWWNGYPPDDRGVCTDVLWKALEGAGYGRNMGTNDFKYCLDLDIAENRHLYPAESLGGSYVNFRRVPNVRVFFERHCQKLTLDTSQIDQWQPGDIVFYEPNHIAIVSNRRNAQGKPWIIHLTSIGALEEDNLDYSRLDDGSVKLVGHYRWISSDAD